MFRPRINGLVQRTVNVGRFKETSHVRHELSQEEQLALLRSSSFPSAPEPLATPGSRLASSGDRIAFADRILRFGSDIAAALKMLEQHHSGKSKKAPLNRIVAALRNGMRKGAGAALSYPVEPEPALDRAMATPHGDARRPAGVRGKTKPHRSLLKTAKTDMLLLELAEEYLLRARDDNATVNDPRENAPPPLTHVAEDNLRLAEEFAQRVRCAAGIHRAHISITNDCDAMIENLEGFDAGTNTALRDELRSKLDRLMMRLTPQSEESDGTLDCDAAFRLAYQTIVDVLAAPGEKANIARAIDMLDELMHPFVTLGELMERSPSGGPGGDDSGSDGSGGNISRSSRGIAIEDARRILQELGPLRHGTEIIQRILVWQHHPAETRKRGLTVREQAMRVLLACSKGLDRDKSGVHVGTRRLLETAYRAARQLYEAPDTVLNTDERIAYLAARNRLLEAGEGSLMQYVADRMSELSEQWIPLAVENPPGSGSGSAAGRALRKLYRHAQPVRRANSSTPFHLKTLKLAANTSTAYGIDPQKTAAQIDQYIVVSLQALKTAVLAIVPRNADPDTLQLLAYVAACEAAMNKMTEQQLRPEHCQLDGQNEGGDADASSTDIARIEEAFVRLSEPVRNNENRSILGSVSAVIVEPLPQLLARPLQGEHVIEAANRLWLAAQALPLDGDQRARDAASAAMVEVRRLADLLDLSAPAITQREDVYRYLSPLVERLQLRGKLRLSNGTLTGINLKPLTYALRASDEILTALQLSKTDFLASVSVSPRIRLEWQAMKNAVIEISMSTVGFEIFIGREKRKSGAAGAGLRVGGGNLEVRAMLSGDKARASERIVQEGVKFMIPRSANKEYSDDAMRREGRMLFDLLFRMSVDENGEIREMDMAHFNSGADVNGVPNNLAAVLALCPHVSVAVTGEMRERNKRWETVAGGALRTTDAFTAAPNGGPRTARGSREVVLTEQSGTTNVERNNVYRGGQAAINGGVAPTASVFSADGEMVDQSARLSANGAVANKQLRIAGKDARFRLVTLDGKTDPVNTRRDVEHTQFGTLFESIEAKREQWIQVGIEHLFNTAEYRKHADAPDDEKRLIVETHFSVMLEELQRREFSEGGARVLRNVFAESYRLTDDAGAAYDTLRDRQTQIESRLEKLTAFLHDRTARRTGDRGRRLAAELQFREALHEQERISAAQSMLLQDVGSWIPWKITASERTLETSQSGFDFFLRVGSAHSADGQRPVKSWPV